MLTALFFGMLVFTIIEEWKFKQKRKKVVAGARFGYDNGNNFIEVEVVEDGYLGLTVRYRIVGEEVVREIHVRDFVKVYVK